MSLHAHITREAEHKLHAQRRNSTIASVTIAILVLVLIGVLLAFVLISPLLKPVPVIVSYQNPTLEDPPVEPKRPSTQVQTKPSFPSSAALAKVIAADVAAPTAVPEVELTDPSQDFGSGIGLGDDWGAGGLGGAGGSGGIFGSASGPGLAGTFYDLKQTAAGAPTDMRFQGFEKSGAFDTNAPVNKIYDEALARATRRNLGSDSLGDFFKAPRELRLTQLYIPRIDAAGAPASFEIGDKVQGRRWAIVYRGTVTAPEAGRYRFVGFADDVLVVIANNREVLDGSLESPLAGAERRKSFHQQHTVNGWKTYEGKWLNIRKGEQLELRILTGERPGGHYSGYLLIEKAGVDYPADGTGARLLPLFKMAPSEMPQRGPTLPGLAPDTSWSIWTAKT